MKERILICSNTVNGFPPAFIANSEKFLQFVSMDFTRIICILKYPDTAPIIIRSVPRIHPFNLSTNGNESTPAPMATAQSANILPLTLP